MLSAKSVLTSPFHGISHVVHLPRDIITYLMHLHLHLHNAVNTCRRASSSSSSSCHFRQTISGLQNTFVCGNGNVPFAKASKQDHRRLQKTGAFRDGPLCSTKRTSAVSHQQD